MATGSHDRNLGRIKALRLHVHSESSNWAILSEVRFLFGLGLVLMCMLVLFCRLIYRMISAGDCRIPVERTHSSLGGFGTCSTAHVSIHCDSNLNKIHQTLGPKIRTESTNVYYFVVISLQYLYFVRQVYTVFSMLSLSLCHNIAAAYVTKFECVFI